MAKIKPKKPAFAPRPEARRTLVSVRVNETEAAEMDLIAARLKLDSRAEVVRYAMEKLLEAPAGSDPAR